MDTQAATNRDRPNWLLTLLILALPFQAVGALDIGVSITADLVFGLLFCVVYARYANLFVLDKYDSILVLFLAWATVSTAWNTMANTNALMTGDASLRGGALRGIIHLARLFFLAVLYKTLKNYLRIHPREIGRVCRLVILSAFVIGLYGFYQVLGGLYDLPFRDLRTIRFRELSSAVVQASDITFVPRAFGTFLEPLNYANFLLMTISLALGWGIDVGRQRRHRGVRFRFMYFLVILVLVCNLVLTFSRGALFVFAAGMILLIVVRPRARLIIPLVGGIGLIIAGAILVIAHVYEAPLEGLWNVMATGLDPTSISTENRIAAMRQALDIALGSPLIGVGLGYDVFFSHVGWWENPLGGDLLSFYGYLLADTGFVGFSLFGLFVVLHIVNNFGLARRLRGEAESIRIFTGLAIFMVVAQMATFIGGFVLYFWFLLALGAGVMGLRPAEANTGSVDEVAGRRVNALVRGVSSD